MELYRDIPQVGFCRDTGHEACFTDRKQFVPFFGDRLAALHINDNIACHNEDDHMIPFDAKIDFECVARQIKDFGFDGTLMLDIHKDMPVYREMSDKKRFQRAYAAGIKLRSMID